MEVPEDQLDSVIEEIATLLATGYLRLRKSRTLSESPALPAPQATEERFDGVAGPRLSGPDPMSPEKGDLS